MTENIAEINHARNALLRSLTKVTHRKYGELVPDLLMALENDPDLIARFCVHMLTGGTKIRDQQDAAIITLLQSSFPQFREAGRVLLLGRDVYNIAEPYEHVRGLPPYRVFRIADYIADSTFKVPRLMKSIMRDYTTALENDPLHWDSVAILNRRALHNAYTHYHIKPGKRAQAVLFTRDYPEDGKFQAIREISQMKKPADRAKAIIEHQIPYRIASTLIPKATPAAGIALIAVMTPTEALNSRAWIEESGLMQNADVRKAYLDKVQNATASIASADHRKSAQGSDADVQAAVETAKQRAVDKTERIGGNIALLIDKSASMENAIAAAIEFAGRIAPLVDGELMVAVHDGHGRMVQNPGDITQLQAWRDTFATIRAGGSTNHEAGWNVFLKAGFVPDKLVMITDGAPTSGRLPRALTEFTDRGHPLQTVFIHVPGQRNTLTNDLNAARVEFEQFDFDCDYYVFDQAIALLGGPGAKSLVEKILETSLPKRV